MIGRTDKDELRSLELDRMMVKRCKWSMKDWLLCCGACMGTGMLEVTPVLEEPELGDYSPIVDYDVEDCPKCHGTGASMMVRIWWRIRGHTSQQ